MKKLVLDVTTNEITEKDFTKKELDLQAKEEEQTILAQEKILVQEQLKESAKTKLAALGLSPDEIAAITGA